MELTTVSRTFVRKIKKHPIIILLILLFLILGLSVVTNYKTAQKIILTQALDSQLKTLGFNHVSYNITPTNWSSIEISDFSLNESPNLSIKKIYLNFNLINQKIKYLSITKLHIDALWDAHSYSLKTPISNFIEANTDPTTSVSKSHSSGLQQSASVLQHIFFGPTAKWLPQEVRVKDATLSILKIQTSTAKAQSLVKAQLNFNARKKPATWSLNLELQLTAQPSTFHVNAPTSKWSLEHSKIKFSTATTLKITTEKIVINAKTATIKAAGTTQYQSKEQSWTLSPLHYKIKPWSFEFPLLATSTMTTTKLPQAKIELAFEPHKKHTLAKLVGPKLSLDLRSFTLTLNPFFDRTKNDDHKLQFKAELANIALTDNSLKLNKLQMTLNQHPLQSNFLLLGNNLTIAKEISSTPLLAPVDFKIVGNHNQGIINSRWQINGPDKTAFELAGKINYDRLKETGHITFHNALTPALPLDKSLPSMSPYFKTQTDTQVTGRLNFSGHLPLANFSFLPRDQKLHVKLQDVAIRREGLSLEKLNTSFTMDAIYPTPQILKLQKFSLAKLVAGPPLKNISFQWRFAQQLIHIESFKADLLGGQLSLATANFDLRNKWLSPLTIDIKSLSLAHVLSLAVEKDLDASGFLDGYVSVKMNSKNIPIITAQLKTNHPGWVKYTSPDVYKIGQSMNPQMGLLLKYLQDLQYKEIKLDFTSDATYQARCILSIFGYSPNLTEIGNRPLKLKIKIDLNIYKAFRSYLLAMNLPKNLEDRLIQSFDKK